MRGWCGRKRAYGTAEGSKITNPAGAARRKTAKKLDFYQNDKGCTFSELVKPLSLSHHSIFIFCTSMYCKMTMFARASFLIAYIIAVQAAPQIVGFGADGTIGVPAKLASTGSSGSSNGQGNVLTSYPNTDSDGRYASKVNVLNGDWKTAVLNAHNFYRRAHGLSDFVYSVELEHALESKVNNDFCTNGDVTTRYQGRDAGSNHCEGSPETLSLGTPDNQAVHFVDGWYNELLNVPISAWFSNNIALLDNALMDRSDVHKTGHMTQMLWENRLIDTLEFPGQPRQLACVMGYSCSGGQNQMTCNYWPSGNRDLTSNSIVYAQYARNIPPRTDMPVVTNFASLDVKSTS